MKTVDGDPVVSPTLVTSKQISPTPQDDRRSRSYAMNSPVRAETGPYYAEYYCCTCGACGERPGTRLDECADCRRWFCGDHLYPCPACGRLLCSACVDEHDCCPIGEKFPKYRSTAASKFSYGVEIEVAGAHDQETMKKSRLIAGWCSEDSVDCPGAGEYQTQPLTCPADTMELTRLISSIEPRGGVLSDAGGHIHVKRTKKQSALAWLVALEALGPRACKAMNMRHMFEGENYYCKPVYVFTGKHVAVNDEHERTIELRTFGPWWGKTAGRLQPAVQWIHGMWDWFEAHDAACLIAAEATSVEDLPDVMQSIADGTDAGVHEALEAASREISTASRLLASQAAPLSR